MAKNNSAINDDVLNTSDTTAATNTDDIPATETDDPQQPEQANVVLMAWFIDGFFKVEDTQYDVINQRITVLPEHVEAAILNGYVLEGGV